MIQLSKVWRDQISMGFGTEGNVHAVMINAHNGNRNII